MQQHLHHCLPEERHVRALAGHLRSDHKQGLSVSGGWHTRRFGVLDGGDVRRRHHHASARPQGGPQRNGEGRPAHHAHRSTHHTGDAHAREAHSLGGRPAQVLAQALDQVAALQSHPAQLESVFAAHARRRPLVQLRSGVVHANHLRRPHLAHHCHNCWQAALSAHQLELPAINYCKYLGVYC